MLNSALAKRLKQSQNHLMDNAPKGRCPSKRKGCIAPASLQIYAPFFSSLSKKFSSDEIRDMIVKTVHFHDSLIENHGVKDGTKRFKAMFAYCTALLESRKAVNPGWVATSKANRFPTKLAHLRSLFIFIKDNNNKPTHAKTVAEGRRLFLTLLKLNRVCKDFNDLDVSNIKKTFRISTKEYNGFEQFVKDRLSKVVKRRRFDESPPELIAEPFFGSLYGPNGVPKLESADAEAYKIVYDSSKSNFIHF